MIILEAFGIKKNFGGVIALRDGNLTCKEGKVTGLLGANGSGKSTICKIITGNYSGDGGRILYCGREVSYKNPNDAKKNGIAMVFQNLSVVPDLNVWQNVVLGMEQKKGLFTDNKSDKAKAEHIIAKLSPGLDIDKKVSDLSPGEMQIVEIAKAIATRPRLLILDEPTAALEQAQVKNLFRYMRELTADGVGMIFTSHRLLEVMEICDDVIVFRNGANVGAVDFSTQEKDMDQIVSLITGETAAQQTKKEYAESSGEYALEVENLNYGKYLVDVSFKLNKGEILGIGGLHGQGQDELLLALAGAVRGTAKSVTLGGRPVKLNSPRSAIRSGIMLVPGDRQNEGLFLENTIYMNMIYPKLALRNQPVFTPRTKYRGESEKIVDILSVKTQSIDVPVNNLSGGNQQKVLVGKWLSFDMNVLLLADPAKGVDVGAKYDLYKFMENMVKERRVSIILYASDNVELVSHCDRVLVMYEGQIVSELKGNEISEDNIVAASMHISPQQASI